MKRFKLVLLITIFGFTGTVFAEQDEPLKTLERQEAYSIGVPVDRIWSPRISGFKPISRKQIVIYTSPSKSYLVTLRSRATGIRFSEAIGITSTGSSIYAKFDAVVVDGFRYPIESITAIDRATAKSLRWSKNKKKHS